ncbi:hypothetical protein XENOCAPTIV_018236 [Xenoophorus captivus]|uniref:PH domain-containing protein n=1 Tax=Xenoophorus captivus TaxID=1517983 RepID=A0ABV0QNK5_9TELE
MFNGVEKDCPSPTEKLARKESLKGPKGENVGSITQPLPSNYLIFRAASESDGRCWMDALELTLSRSSLYKMTPKAGKEGDISMTSESSHILQLLHSSPLTDTELQQKNAMEFSVLFIRAGHVDPLSLNPCV